jgi:phosphatidate cytidylyltransferase
VETFLKPNPAVLTTEIALGVIALGTILLALVKLARRRQDLSFYTRRFAAWWTMGIVFLLSVSVGRLIPLLFLGAVSFLAVREYFTVVASRLEDRRAILWVYLSIPVQYYWASWGQDWYGLFVVFIPVCMFLSVPFRMVFSGKPEGLVASIGRIHWGMMLFVFAISHLAALLYVDDQPYQGSLLLFVVILTEITDAVQFLVGALTRRMPVVPELTSRKTWPGFLASVAAGAAIGPSLSFLTPFGRIHDAALIGAGIAVAGFAGSVVVAAIRRDVGAPSRDTRVIDQIDSHCYTAPLFYHLVYLAGVAAA